MAGPLTPLNQKSQAPGSIGNANAAAAVYQIVRRGRKMLDWKQGLVLKSPRSGAISGSPPQPIEWPNWGRIAITRAYVNEVEVRSDVEGG